MAKDSMQRLHQPQVLLCMLVCVSLVIKSDASSARGYKITLSRDPYSYRLVERYVRPSMLEKLNTFWDFFRPPRISPKPKPVVAPSSGQLIRLDADGTVQVYKDDQWGLVCDDRWDLLDANVACTHLGFHRGASSTKRKDSVQSSRYGTSGGNLSIVMDEVQCTGREVRLDQCLHQTSHDCSTDEAAAVQCLENEGCPSGWSSANGKCYRIGTALSVVKAAIFCHQANANLANILSQAENDFLSNLLKRVRSTNREFYTGATRSSQGVWRWYTLRHDDVTGRAGRLVRFTKWFPGWISHNNANSEPHTGGAVSRSCLALSDQFDTPYGAPTKLDYFYWRAVPCSPRHTGSLQFICERDAGKTSDVKDCYTGTGTSYRGHAYTTEKGSVCQRWTQSAAINQRTHPGKGLGTHSYCRNPDGDSRPWCWVNHTRRTYGYCRIAVCPPLANNVTNSTDATPTPLTAPATTAKTNSEVRQDDVKVRLVGGDTEHSGTVEVKYMGLTGVICDDMWDNLDAAVICRMLGYRSGSKATTVNAFHYSVNRPVNFLLDSVQCRGNETSISLCPHDPWHRHNCRTNEIAGVRCQVSKACTQSEYRCPDDGQCLEANQVCDRQWHCSNGADEDNCTVIETRLVNGRGPWEGRVEVTRNGLSGSVCDDRWDEKDAAVVCATLGYRYGGVAVTGGQFGQDQGPVWLDNVECRGNETGLELCLHLGWARHDCSHSEDAGVRCHRHPPTPPPTTTTTTTTTTTSKDCSPSQFRCTGNGKCIEAPQVCDRIPHCPEAKDELYCNGSSSVTLVNGTDPWEGWVEVTRNGLAGSVCDDQWDDRDASVVCGMLGYRHGGVAITDHRFGLGLALFWLDEVSCVGNETTLDQCHHAGWGRHDCGEFEAAGVSCHRPSTGTTTTDTTTIAITTIRSTIATTTQDLYGIQVSLVGGHKEYEGNVAVTFMTKDYRICDDSWDDKAASVICRMLGYWAGGVATKMSYFGGGQSDIILDNVQCSGQETSLMECKAYVGVNSHDCRNTEYAGVKCHPGLETSTNSPSSAPVTIRPGTQNYSVCGLRPYDKKDLFTMTGGQRSRRSPIMSYGHNSGHRYPRRRHFAGGHPTQHKILGGNIADHGANPWQVRVVKIYNIQMTGRLLTTHICGAVIISEYWVLSAAHCYWRKWKSQFRILVGDHHKNMLDRGEQAFRVEDIFIHPYYNGNGKDYDISLLKIQPKNGRGIQFNDFVQPACLPSAMTPYKAGTRCVISGWGSTRRGYPNTLKAAMVPLISWSKCQRLYDYRKTGLFTRRMFCAGFERGGSDTCDGDSGGPLVCHVNGAYTLFGTTSWGRGCAKANSPGVYARVSEYLPWIDEVMSRYSKGKQQGKLPRRP